MTQTTTTTTINLHLKIVPASLELNLEGPHIAFRQSVNREHVMLLVVWIRKFASNQWSTELLRIHESEDIKVQGIRVLLSAHILCPNFKFRMIFGINFHNMPGTETDILLIVTFGPDPSSHW